MKLSRLTRAAGPWMHLLTATAAEAWAAVHEFGRESQGRVAVRCVRGLKAATRAAFFDEAAAALHFPPTFGENWDAFYDCLTDLAWLPAEGYVL